MDSPTTTPCTIYLEEPQLQVPIESERALKKKKTERPSLTPAERALDDSSDDSGPDEPKTPDRREKGEGERSCLIHSHEKLE